MERSKGRTISMTTMGVDYSMEWRRVYIYYFFKGAEEGGNKWLNDGSYNGINNGSYEW